MNRLLFCVLALLGLSTFPASAQLAAVNSPTGPVMAGPYVVVDVASGEALLERGAGTPWYPASLTKLMTLYVVFEELKAGRLRIDDPVVMSQNALKVEYAGHLGVPVGGTFTVEIGVNALVVRSLNDVATALAEKVSGSEAVFAQRMNDTARRLGMTATHFANAHGLPNAGQITTARDMAVLGVALVKDFPQYYPYFQTRDFVFGKRKFGPGIKFVELYSPYAEGMKTGFICASGFNIVGSAVRDGRRLVAASFGFRRGDLRDEFLTRLFDKAFVLKTGGNRQKVWQLRNDGGAPPWVIPYGECGTPQYSMPGDAAWVGTYGDWRTAKTAFDKGQAALAEMGVAVLGKEWILPVTREKTTRQAAIIADLQPEAAAKLCESYLAKKQFCQVKKAQEMTPAAFGGFWR